MIGLDEPWVLSPSVALRPEPFGALAYHFCGIPTSMFTPLFAVARTVGWIAHWIEMLTDPDAKLVRPRQLYVGPEMRHFVPIDQR